MSTTPNLDKLQNDAEKLVALLKDRHPGLFTWWDSVRIHVQSISELYAGQQPEAVVCRFCGQELSALHPQANLWPHITGACIR